VTETNYAVSPGEYIKEWLQENRYTQTLLAKKSGISLKHLNQVVNARVRLTESVAFKIAEATNLSAVALMRYEAAYRSDLRRLGDHVAPRTSYSVAGVRRYGIRCENCDQTYYRCSKSLFEAHAGPCCDECEMEDMHDVPSLAEQRQLEEARQAELDADWLAQHSLLAVQGQGREGDNSPRPAPPDPEVVRLERLVDTLNTRLSKVKAYLKFVEGRGHALPTIQVSLHPSKKRTDPRVKHLRKASLSHLFARQRRREAANLASYGPEYF